MEHCSIFASRLFRTSSPKAQVIDTLVRFGTGPVKFACERDVSIVVVDKTQRYRDASKALARMDIDVDAWPAPPAGLFVVEERTIYLRSLSPMTVAHEFGHALDCALGDGVYHSGIDVELRDLFNAARTFVTPYAATSIDEYFGVIENGDILGS